MKENNDESKQNITKEDAINVLNSMINDKNVNSVNNYRSKIMSVNEDVFKQKLDEFNIQTIEDIRSYFKEKLIEEMEPEMEMTDENEFIKKIIEQDFNFKEMEQFITEEKKPEDVNKLIDYTNENIKEDYSTTYNTIEKVYTEINKNGINAYMIGGISSAIQAGIDLYRQNEDIDLMVEKKDLPQLMESLKKIGYKVEDKRCQLTENYVDAEGTFHPADHELNADINNPDMLGVGIFVFERKDGTVITNSYAYEENAKAVIGNQSIMPEELFDLMYSNEKIEYKGTPVRCQSKEFTYLSKSSGNREKDKLDASVIEKYIGKDEQKKIDRIRTLQKRIVRYKNIYDKDGNIISSKKIPGMEDKISNFIAGITAQNSDLSIEELKEVILGNETVKKYMEQDEDIKNIMNAIKNSRIEGDLVEESRNIAHSYLFDDIQEKNTNEKEEQENIQDQNKIEKEPELSTENYYSKISYFHDQKSDLYYSEQRIGKATVNTPTKNKDRAYDKVLNKVHERTHPEEIHEHTMRPKSE